MVMTVVILIVNHSGTGRTSDSTCDNTNSGNSEGN